MFVVSLGITREYHDASHRKCMHGHLICVYVLPLSVKPLFFILFYFLFFFSVKLKHFEKFQDTTEALAGNVDMMN